MLSGNLSQFSVVDALQFVGFTQRSAVVEVLLDNQSVSLLLRQGRIVGAVVKPCGGIEQNRNGLDEMAAILSELIETKRGRFEVAYTEIDANSGQGFTVDELVASARRDNASRRLETWAEAAGMIEFFTRISDAPLVVAANRVDDDDPRALDLRIALGVGEDVPVLGTDAHDPGSVKQILLALLLEVLIRKETDDQQDMDLASDAWA